jgi:ornithine cyclodeaminase/alanine dehydrogenase-like protein (mu-crystallin family)
MLVLDGAAIRASVSMKQVVDCLEEAFRADCVVPLRQVVPVPGPEATRLFVSMPAFDQHGAGVVKIATVFPSNPEKGVPTVQAIVVAFSELGTPTAVLDGNAVTYLRTGAASALASRYLSRADSVHLVIIGTGALAPMMAAAHCAVRTIRRISVWGRRRERATATAAVVRSQVGRDVQVVVAEALDQAVPTADIVTCATSSPTAVLLGRWVRPGTFVDLVGSFSPATREADDEVVRRARLFVDTFEGALAEAGDLIQPLKSGLINRNRIEGELADLVRRRVVGRTTRDEITLFKSVGTAIEDLAATRLIVAACGVVKQ